MRLWALVEIAELARGEAQMEGACESRLFIMQLSVLDGERRILRSIPNASSVAVSAISSSRRPLNQPFP